ncbi:MAG: MFS transporter [Acidobacteria bacterium]|nr:MFS transporter [Acidobacteriota bacterium]
MPPTVLHRLERLPATRSIWRLVVLLSIGGAFEFYDLILTGYASPGLIRSGIFHKGPGGIFGMTDQGTFAAITFLGLFLGTLLLGFAADRFGRRAIFTFSLLWYAVATAIMAAQHSAAAVDLWRFIAGVGIGVELVTIDSYISELVPASVRGRAFALNQAVQFCAVPVVAFLAWKLVPRDPLGIAGWRWLVLIPALGAAVVWWIRRRVPESPRWLVEHGRSAEAERIVSRLEQQVERDLQRRGASLPPAPDILRPATGDPCPPAARLGVFAEIFGPAYRGRTVMLVALNFFQSIGYYGFNNWVPALIASRGIGLVQSLHYSFVIAIAFPLSPLLFLLFSDRIERKWQIVIAAAAVSGTGLAFAAQSQPALLILFGLLLTISTNLLSYSYHAYQAELFPTRIRARAVGFVYSFSRISTVLSSFAIAFLLERAGAGAVFAFIAGAMLMVVVAVAPFGPRTRNQPLEAISR